MFKKFLLFLISLFLIGGAFFFFTRSFSPSINTNEKLTVVTSFYPLEYFSKKVGGDTARILTLTPSGAEPHDYEPTPRDIVNIKTSNAFIFNGAGLENWTNALVPQLDSQKIHIIKVSDSIDLLSATDSDSNGMPDPHIWLDPVRAQKEVAIIRDAFISLDPSHASLYTQNAKTFTDELSRLENEYREGLKSCKRKEIITSHDAFRYLADQFGFQVYSVSGSSPNQDPSPKHIADMVTLARSKQIHFILTETLSSPKFVDTIAKEANLQTLVFNPIEGLTDTDKKQGKDYLIIMRENLKNLKTAMECE